MTITPPSLHQPSFLLHAALICCPFSSLFSISPFCDSDGGCQFVMVTVTHRLHASKKIFCDIIRKSAVQIPMLDIPSTHIPATYISHTLLPQNICGDVLSPFTKPVWGCVTEGAVCCASCQHNAHTPSHTPSHTPAPRHHLLRLPQRSCKTLASKVRSCR